MEEIKAKWVFEQGGFAKAVIAPTPMGAGYHLHLVKFGRNAETEVLERQRGGWRVFKTIDAGVNTAHTIGFRRIEVDLSSLKAAALRLPTPERGATDCASRSRSGVLP